MIIKLFKTTLFTTLCCLTVSAEDKTPPEKTPRRVIFYHNGNQNFLTPPIATAISGAPIEVKMNGTTIGTINFGEYVTALVYPGKYTIELTHWEIFPVSSDHKINVPDADIYVGCSITLTSNDIVGSTEPPKNFAMDYKKPSGK